jgi:hypothetical protein
MSWTPASGPATAQTPAAAVAAAMTAVSLRARMWPGRVSAWVAGVVPIGGAAVIPAGWPAEERADIGVIPS